MGKMLVHGVSVLVAVVITAGVAFAGQFDGVSAPSDWEAISPYHYWLGHKDRPRQIAFINKKTVNKLADGTYTASVLVFRETPEVRGEDNKLTDGTYFKVSIDCNKQTYAWDVLNARLRQPGDESGYQWVPETASANGLTWRKLDLQKKPSWDDFVIYHLCGASDLK